MTPLFARETSEGHTVHLPSIRAIAKHAGRQIIESWAIPLGLFYTFTHFVGLQGGVLAGLAWAYVNIARRIVTRQRIPGTLMLAAMLFSGRAAIALATHSAFIYFLQPTLGTFMVASLFLSSVWTRKPLAEKLAADFCPLPEALMTNPRMRRFFLQISLLWGFVQLTNGACTLWLLLSSSLGTFLLVKSFASIALTWTAVFASYKWFRRSMRDEGVVLRWGGAPAV